jgi:hypothetical protein
MPRVVASLLCASAICLLPLSAVADDESPQRCIAKTAHVYGFHCWGSANFGAGFEVANFVGTVEGNGKGIFEGYGTVSSSAGSFATHFAGPATFGRHCSGRVQYTTNEILLPGGGVVPLGTAMFDFAMVDGGKEILGASVAPFGVTGDQVPRLTCRLVRVR